MQSGRVFERCIHPAYDAKTPHNYTLHIMSYVPECVGQAVVERLCEESLFPLRLDEVQESISEFSFIRRCRELCRDELRWKKWSFGHGHLHAKKKASREADPFFAC